ncbi:hypothetical protein [Filomicrobium sp.]|uniref:hypothetical protein n=1 Tax=Filomicrobium sp. TaxID=2024831 RepID=UPI00258B56E6|nr:hypothetical protein [Filomicrobium sp.]MCV0371721.1 hypothetical protein [Filomicrobium sp.]
MNQTMHLVITICSILRAPECHTERLTFFVDNLTPYACFHTGQAEIAKWSTYRLKPDERIARWRCERPKLSAKA